jgi:hypothetical protein
MEDGDVAVHDYNMRDLDKKPYTVRITETLELSMDIEARNAEEAEGIVRSEYKNGTHILRADHFTDVDFNVLERRGVAESEI